MSGSQENKIIAVLVPPSEIKINMTPLLTHRAPMSTIVVFIGCKLTFTALTYICINYEDQRGFLLLGALIPF